MWQPIDTVPPHIQDGDPFLARWKDCMGKWETVIAYYGQFGHCFLWYPMGYHAGAEVWVEEGEGVNGSGFAIGDPKISPTEWCDIPEEEDILQKRIALLENQLALEQGKIHTPDAWMARRDGLRLARDRVTLLEKTLDLCAAQAGTPNAADGCRLILATIKEVRDSWAMPDKDEV